MAHRERHGFRCCDRAPARNPSNPKASVGANPSLGLRTSCRPSRVSLFSAYFCQCRGLGENAARLAIVALTGYALLPILRNTYVGIDSLDDDLRYVADAMGMTSWQRLKKVELPLAASVILAGVRTATVTCVGVATIAAAIGAGGLGELIFRGVASVDNGLVLAGAIPAALLALVADAALGWIEKRVTVRRS